MKIKYEFVNETVELDVPKEWGDILVDMDRQEHNNNRRETRRHYHYEACEYEGADFAAWDANITAIFEGPSDEERLLEAISRLKPEQKELVRAIYFDGESVNSYAAREGVSQSAISHRLKTVKNKLKKLLK